MRSTRILSFAFLTALAGVAHAELNYPGDFPIVFVERAKVIAELREAQATGQLIKGDLYPPPEPQALPTKTRAQVVAELREAQRLGLISHGEGDPPSSTAEQERLITVAGEAAVQSTKMHASR